MKQISLEKSKKIKLFKRFETKYLVDVSQIHDIVNYLSKTYYVVSEGENTLFDYHSIYFDNDNFDMAKAHENQDEIRQKVRIREYQNKDKFVEIKEKNPYKTIKSRIPINSYDINNEYQWINNNLIYNTETLKKVLDIKYKRLTFIGQYKSTRITLDFNINIYNYLTNQEYIIDKFVVIEIKKNKDIQLEFEEYLKNLHIEKTSFSKYHYGIKQTSKILNNN